MNSYVTEFQEIIEGSIASLNVNTGSLTTRSNFIIFTLEITLHYLCDSEAIVRDKKVIYNLLKTSRGQFQTINQASSGDDLVTVTYVVRVLDIDKFNDTIKRYRDIEFSEILEATLKQQ